MRNVINPFLIRYFVHEKTENGWQYTYKIHPLSIFDDFSVKDLSLNPLKIIARDLSTNLLLSSEGTIEERTIFQNDILKYTHEKISQISFFQVVWRDDAWRLSVIKSSYFPDTKYHTADYLVFHSDKPRKQFLKIISDCERVGTIHQIDKINMVI